MLALSPDLLVVFVFFFMVCAHRAFQIGIRGSKES
jgi:hypothetical protein